jgi:hypothetical protein
MENLLATHGSHDNTLHYNDVMLPAPLIQNYLFMKGSARGYVPSTKFIYHIFVFMPFQIRCRHGVHLYRRRQLLFGSVTTKLRTNTLFFFDCETILCLLHFFIAASFLVLS